MVHAEAKQKKLVELIFKVVIPKNDLKIDMKSTHWNSHFVPGKIYVHFPSNTDFRIKEESLRFPSKKKKNTLIYKVNIVRLIIRFKKKKNIKQARMGRGDIKKGLNEQSKSEVYIWPNYLLEKRFLNI